jgi:predicted tellurium resistance membrane protein TerC
MEYLLTGDAILSLITLTILEIVLGVDNVIFVSIIMGRLDESKQKTARKIWMLTGITVRILLLLSLSWLVKNGSSELFSLFGKSFNLRGLIMLGGFSFAVY